MKRGSSAYESFLSRGEERERFVSLDIVLFLFFLSIPSPSMPRFRKRERPILQNVSCTQKANHLITTRLKPFDARLVDTIRHRTADRRFLRRRVIRNYGK